jgi:hypothetical protein
MGRRVFTLVTSSGFAIAAAVSSQFVNAVET